jgi:hypothetical protein
MPLCVCVCVYVQCLDQKFNTLPPIQVAFMFQGYRKESDVIILLSHIQRIELYLSTLKNVQIQRELPPENINYNLQKL